VSVIDNGTEDNDGDNAGEISKGQTIDDVCGGSSSTGLSQLLDMDV